MPSFNDYIQNTKDYELFLAFGFMGAFLLAYFIVKYAKKAKRQFSMPLALWAIVGLGLAVRIPLMGSPFWYDEAFTSAMTQLPFPQMLVAVSSDVHPPLYYAIVKLFTLVFGHNDFAMRLPALLSGLALIPTMYAIAGKGRIGKWAALLTAIMPATVYYSTEARYPEFMALMLSVGYLGIQRNKAAIAAPTLAAAALSHVNSWLYVAVLLVVWAGKGAKLRGLILPLGAIAAWLPIALNQAETVKNGFWLNQYIPIRHIVETTIGGRFESANAMILPLIIVLTIIIVAVFQWRKNATWEWLALVAGVPAMQSVVGLVAMPIYLPRTLMFSSLLLLIPVAWFIDRYSLKWLTGLGGLAMVFSLNQLYTVDRTDGAYQLLEACEGFNTVYSTNNHAAILARHYTDSEVIVFHRGNSIAQPLSASAQNILFDGIGNIELTSRSGVCLFTQVSVFSTESEMAHLNRLRRLPHFEEVYQKAETGYYVVMIFETNLSQN